MAGTLETNADPVTEIANLNERITRLEQSTEKHELVKNLANVATCTERLVRDMAGALETNMQGVKDINQEMEKLRTDINKITAKESNDDLVKKIAKLEARMQVAEQSAHNDRNTMAQQAARLMADAYYENLVTGIVTSITERQVKNLQNELQTIKQLDHKVEEVIKVNGRIAKIE